MEILFNALPFVARIIAFATAIPVHETAHAFVSDKLGDHTARYMGRLTLNPLKHLDPWGLLAMLTIGIGWAKPVPVNPSFYKNRKVGMAITAAAGPLSNLVLALINMALLKLVLVFAAPAAASQLAINLVGALANILLLLILININLALFNLLPIPPFDGSRIFGLILPDKIYFGIQRYEKYIMIGFIVAVLVLPRVLGVNPLGWLLTRPSYAIMDGMDYLTYHLNIRGIFGIA